MKKNDLIYLKHMIDAIELIDEFVRGIEDIEFQRNQMMQAAVIREIEIIGEASKRVSLDIKNHNGEIPWKKISGMRDKLIHGYFGVDMEAVWKTVKKDIPVLQARIKKIIEEIQQEQGSEQSDNSAYHP